LASQRRNIDAVLWPLIFIVTDCGTSLRTMLRTLVLRIFAKYDRRAGNLPVPCTHLFYMATKEKTKTKIKAKTKKRRPWLTLEDALRRVRKEHPGLSSDLQRRMAQRKATLDELASHVERYREEHAT
jgi:hypothetical protein